MDVCRFQNFVLRCPTPRLHCFLSSHRPSFRFLSFMAFLIPSILFFSVFLMLSFVSASTSMLFWVIFLLPFLSYICNWDKCLSRSTRSLLSCGRRWKTPVISSSQRTRLATSATAERDTSWQFIGMARQGWSSTWTWQTSQTHKKPGIFKMTLFFPTQVWDEKKWSYTSQCPQSRGWNGVLQIKLSMAFTLSFLQGFFFLWTISWAAEDSPVVNKRGLSIRLQLVIKKIADGILSLTEDIFKRSEASYELIV